MSRPLNLLPALMVLALVLSSPAVAGGDKKDGDVSVVQTTAPPPTLPPPAPPPPVIEVPLAPIVAQMVPQPPRQRCAVVPLGTTVRYTPPVMVPALNGYAVSVCGRFTYVAGLAGGSYAGGETKSTGILIQPCVD